MMETSKTWLSDLAVPTTMNFGLDGKLYVFTFGAEPAGAGQTVWIAIPERNARRADVLDA
jgi:hypothetical protein